MPKKYIRWLFACAALLVFCSCRTSEVSSYPAYPNQPLCGGRPVLANLKGVNYGFFLFGFIPLWSGDPKRPNSSHYETLRNMVKEDYNLMMLQAHARRRYGNGKLADCRHTEHFSGIYTLFIVWRKVLITQALWVAPLPPAR